MDMGKKSINIFSFILCLFILGKNKVNPVLQIDLTIKGSGRQQILSSHFSGDEPDEVLVNGENVNYYSKFVNNLQKEENNILMKWDNKYNISHRNMFRNLSNIIKINITHYKNDLTIDNMGYMFHSCKSLTSIKFNNINTSKVTTMAYMFYGCSSLVHVDLYNFNTSNVKYMNYMFYGCKELISLNLNFFDTSSVTTMKSMFTNCELLKELNINNFKVGSVKDMSNMFMNCFSLKTLNLSNFNASSVKNMANMFYKCFSLEIIDLTNFYTSSVTDIRAMFSSCRNLKSIDLSSFNTSLVNNMSFLFYQCSKLSSLNLNNFNTTSVLTMYAMFHNCSSLTSLSLSSFNTSSVINMTYMFSFCQSLESLNLKMFNTSSVIQMSNMFDSCTKLKSLEINGFNTTSVTTMKLMFYSCSSLKSLDLSSFTTTSLVDTEKMFYLCNDYLIYCINKPNGNVIASLLTYPSKNNCSYFCIHRPHKIIYGTDICIDDCNDEYKYEYNNICHKTCPKRTTIQNRNGNICIDLNCNYYYNYNQTGCISEIPDGYYINNTILKTIDKCHVECKTCTKGKSYNNSNCDSCLDSKYLYLGNCISECPNRFYTDDYNNNICNSYLNKCKNYTNESSQYDLCISCNIKEGFYPKYNDSSNIDNFINCYKEPEGYFLYNNIYYQYEPTYYKSEIDNTDIILSDTNLINNFHINYTNIGYNINENKTNFLNNINSSEIVFTNYISENGNDISDIINQTKSTITNYINKNESDIIEYVLVNKSGIKDNHYSYENYITNYKTENENDITDIFNHNENDTTNYISTNQSNKEDDMNKNITDIKSVLYDNIIQNISDFINKFTIKNISNINEIDKIINDIRNNLMNGTMNSLISELIEADKKDLLIKEDNFLYQITSSENQVNNKYDNISTIILGECEDILKKEYKIHKNMPLIILKIDYYKPGTLIPIIGYEVFHPITKIKLDLSFCKDVLVNFNLPVSIDENNLFKYDPNNEYYTNECYPSTTEKETDILINDRQNEYNNNNMSICENNCTFNEYDKEAKKATCECGIKTKQLVISELINNTNTLSYNFTNVDQSSNIVTMKCYYTLFTKNGLIKNIGSYILLFTILFILISGILFNKCGYHSLEDDIEDVMNLIEKEKINKDINRNETIDIKAKAKSKNKKVKKNEKKEKIKNQIKSKSKIYIKNNHSNKRKIKRNKKNFICVDNTKTFSDLKLSINKNINFPNVITKNKKSYNIKNLDTFELNSFSYNEALTYDKRKFISFYVSLIRIKHPLIFSFCPMKDYNSRIIKIDLFFLSFCIYCFINSLFFDEKTIHKIYKDEGIYNFIYLAPHILYSFVISHTLFTIIKFFSLSERNIYEIKKSKNFEDANNKVEKVKRCLIIKYILFFILSIIFLLFFWYYLASFGAVYQNTQIYLIKNILISFGLSMIYPFVIYLLPAIIRIYSLKKSNRQSLYKLSKIIQII